MQNENLFDKIRQTSLNDVSGTDDFNPEKLWAEIQRQQQRSRIWPWRISAAASVLILVGLGISILMRKQNYSPSAAVNEIVKTQLDNQTGKNIKESGEPVEVHRGSSVQLRSNLSSNVTVREGEDDLKLADTVIPEKVGGEDFIADTIVTSAFISNSAGQIQLDKAAIDTLKSVDLIFPESGSEKVLIADISFPDHKAEAPSTLARMFEQVKKDRLSRKNRLQFNRTYNKPGLWSFVHHSFKEYPAPNN